MHNKRPFLYACQKSSIMVKQAQGFLKCLPQILFLIQTSLSKKWTWTDASDCHIFNFIMHYTHQQADKETSHANFYTFSHIFRYIQHGWQNLDIHRVPHSWRWHAEYRKWEYSSSSHLVTLPHCNIISVFTVTGLTCRISRWQWVWLLAEYCKRKEFAVSLTSCDELSVSPPLSFLSFFLRNISSSYGRKVFYLTFAYTQWVS